MDELLLRNLAILNASIARAIIRALGMHAENMESQVLGETMVHKEEDFQDLINEERIRVNDVITLLQGGSKEDEQSEEDEQSMGCN